jgi:hypothetical protein
MSTSSVCYLVIKRLVAGEFSTISSSFLFAEYSVLRDASLDVDYCSQARIAGYGYDMAMAVLCTYGLRALCSSFASVDHLTCSSIFGL